MYVSLYCYEQKTSLDQSWKINSSLLKDLGKYPSCHRCPVNWFDKYQKNIKPTL